MGLGLDGYRITVIAEPQDMRCGARSLSIIAKDTYLIDVMLGIDAVVFVSKRRASCRIVFARNGVLKCLDCRRDTGNLKKIPKPANGSLRLIVTEEALERYIEGYPLL